MSQPKIGRLVFVYLGYADDSGTVNEKNRIAVYAAVLIPADNFLSIETMAGFAIETLIPEEKHALFQEFHACDLYHGRGVFEGIPPEKRHNVISALISALIGFDGSNAVIYGAVDKERLKRGPYSTANPADIAFRTCLDGIELWLRQLETKENRPSVKVPSCLLIVDDVQEETQKTENPLRAILKNSFRQKRRPIRPPNRERGELSHIHDDLYFGDSRNSVGIQLADLCAYFIGLHLSGNADASGFYATLKDSIKFDRVEPRTEL